MGINGTTSTSLIVNDGPTIKIQSTSGNIGCIYLRKAITFNDVILTCSVKGEKHSIDSEGTIKLIRGTYNIGSSGGKGIKSENNLYIGEENGSDSLLDLTIDTNNIGIEAKQIEIYSGKILIFVDKDGIKAVSSGKVCDKETVHCSGNCTCYINYKGGKMFLTSGEVGLDLNGDITITGGEISVYSTTDGAYRPIDQDGLLSITGGTVLAAGSDQCGVNAETTQIAKIYTGTINSGVKLVAKDSNDNGITIDYFPINANYLYFNHESSFTITIDDTEVTLLEPSQLQEGREHNTGNSEYIGHYLTRINLIMIIIGLISF